MAEKQTTQAETEQTTRAVSDAFSLSEWVEANKTAMLPPVGAVNMFPASDSYVIICVSGPNIRADYHINETEEFFMQLTGDMVLKVIDNGEFKDVTIKQGDVFLLPPNVPHSPQRPAGTVGLVVERKRDPHHIDRLAFYCDDCHELLYMDEFHCTNLPKQIEAVVNTFYADEALRTCRQCGAIAQKPSFDADDA
ncbi:3-hydroxyanthranilate 3,4-dioxygenase [Thecamonas trahens ATCC 50062]|uniref:3-hydroxyanthranilate 3,4-dioxygenase n=1 Tax=Thecamonas trahens ATCC 50062 TaxID=461836 RepID=A0A0L0DPA9_THETB|nr:3-hydroxyanthranilate 3,4-dioxygenase [Thecamonas trahens ATCC 50062]KNC54134.1 3-hydroxyanthranilate 3,4-dioxygenase [Thecamonas trahens ATCC 50062]|eukprot:XP_013753956.1 3-hydroxyanthranilate 3,4-dioxygenase [Thecamonas trahens ATCC 50062]